MFDGHLRKKYLFGYLLICLFLITLGMLFSSKNSIATYSEYNSDIQKNTFEANYIDHDPIVIVTDDNFTDYGFPGTGTSEDPYLIDNLEISSLDHYFIDNGISIQDTTKHFVIKNCLISADLRAIVVTNVTANTAQIISNSFSECQYGIKFSYAEGMIIRNNNLANCESYAVYGEHINKNATITKNTRYNFEGGGIRMRHCNNVTIDSNEFTNGGSGISLTNSSGYIINNICSYAGGISTGSTDFDEPIYFWNNTIERNDGDGISASYATEVINNTLNYNYEGGLDVSYHAHLVLNNTIRGNKFGADFNSVGVFSKNKILRNRNIGLYFDDTKSYDDSNITDNIFFANGIGIKIDYSVDYANISYNLFQENDHYAIELVGYDVSVIVHHNTFYDNTGGNSQGFDDRTTNLWFDLDAEEGNYWSDWTGEGWYLIDGGDNADIYPLSEPLHERFIEPIDKGSYMGIIIPFIIEIPVIIAIILISRYKKKKI